MSATEILGAQLELTMTYRRAILRGQEDLRRKCGGTMTNQATMTVVPAHISDVTGRFCGGGGLATSTGRCQHGCDHADHYANDGHPACEESTHRPATFREQTAWYPHVGDRVGLLGTDVVGTILQVAGLGDGPLYVEWDTPTDAGLEEWIAQRHLGLVAVPL